MWTRIPSSALRLTGEDRQSFVQGQITADLRGEELPAMVPAAFLSVKGQIEFFSFIYKRAEDIYLHLDAGQAGNLAARLNKYIIFDQVKVQDLSDELRTVHVWNPQAIPGWQPQATAQTFLLGGARVLTGRVNRTGTPGVDLHYLTREEHKVLPLLRANEVPLAVLDEHRIRAGIPDVVRDGLTGYLPQEVGLDVSGPLPAISYNKGCYVGQEVMARLHARGNTQYHLAQLRGELPSHAEITLGGKVVGQTGLNAGGHSLARLRKDIDPQAELQVGGQVAQFVRYA